MTDPTPAPRNLDEALLRLQADPPRLVKDQAGQVGNQKTKYADLIQANAIILPRLTALGVLWWTAPTLRMIPGPNGQQDPRFVLDWELRHLASDTFREGSYPLPAGANPMQNGSAITYARRYALLAVTNTVAEDDDDDGRGYAGRAGTARREIVRPAPAPQGPTAQRSQPAARGERARPVAQPELPPARTAPAAPPGPDVPTEPHRGRGGLITEPMTKKLAITMREVVGDDPAGRKQFITDMIGREVATSKDLTFDEGRGLIDAFEKAKKTDNPIGNVTEIYQRASGSGAERPTSGAPASRGRQADTRSAREQTRDSVLGRPAQPGDEPPPWEGIDDAPPEQGY